jgi:peptidoglycan hydrolase-like amidase
VAFMPAMPPSSGLSQDLNFDSLVRGFIPSTLTDLLSTVVNKKEVATINNTIFSTAQAIFRDEIWDFRCNEFVTWEQTKNISNSSKKLSSSGYDRNVRNRVNLSTRSRTSSSNRWKSWISQAIDTGRPWSGFHIHINSLVSRLVQRF